MMLHIDHVVFLDSVKQSDVIYASEEDGILIRCSNANKALSEGTELFYEKWLGEVVIVRIAGNE